MDFSTWLDWRSSAGVDRRRSGMAQVQRRLGLQMARPLSLGRAGSARHTTQNDGQTNPAISWSHQQDFSHDSHLNTNFNYVTSTTLQRQNTFNPYTALATICVAGDLSDEARAGVVIDRRDAESSIPAASRSIETFPTVSLTSTAISVGKLAQLDAELQLQPKRCTAHGSAGPWRVQLFRRSRDRACATAPESKSRSSAQTSLTFDTPLQIFGYDLRNSFHVYQQRNNFPQQFQIYDVHTGEVTDTRVFAATYCTYVDWTPGFHAAAASATTDST